MSRILISDEKNTDKLRVMAVDLWTLLDDIDTLDDSCRENDAAFRRLTRNIQKKRHTTLTSNGYVLYLP